MVAQNITISNTTTKLYSRDPIFSNWNIGRYVCIKNPRKGNDSVSKSRLPGGPNFNSGNYRYVRMPLVTLGNNDEENYLQKFPKFRETIKMLR